MSELKVGAGKVSLTPSDNMYPFPLLVPSLGNYDCPYDDMSCRAVAISNGQKALLFITYELCSVPFIEGLEEKISTALDFNGEIVLAATHNHSCIFDTNIANEEGVPEEVAAKYDYYKDLELQASIDACRLALDGMRPAKYGFGEIDSYINVNRDYLSPYGYWIEARNPEGYSDRTLACIKFVDMNGKLIAAIVNHGTHAVCAFLQRDFDHKMKTSGNFTGIACRFAEQHFGNGAVILWTSGSAGNQNPLLSHGLQYEYPDGYSTSVPYPDGVGYMEMEYMGRYHGADIVKCIDSIDKYSMNMPIKRVAETIGLPKWAKKVNDGELTFRMGGMGVRDYNEIPYGAPPAIPEPPEMIPTQNDCVPLRMQILVLGNIALVLVNAELYAQLGKSMKDAAPYKQTVVVTVSDTREELRNTAGYILDKGSAHHKVFQAYSNGVIPGSADKILVDEELKLFDEALC